LLEKQWPQITKVAFELLDKEKLSGKRINEIMHETGTNDQDC
jgi:hypothetical protein